MWRLLLVLPLTACSLDASGPCRLQQVADLPVTLVRGTIEVPGLLNRAEAQFVIDTGAARTVLSTAAVKSFLLARSQHSATRLNGIAGGVSGADVYATLQLGEATFQQRLAEADVPGIVGLVGGDMLSEYDVEFDLPHDRFRLWHAPGCGASNLPWTGRLSAIPIRVTEGEQLRVPVTVNGITLDAMLDSGTSISLLPTDSAQRLGTTQAALAADPQFLTRGIGSGTVSVRIHRFNSLSVGEDLIRGPQIGVGEIQIGRADMLLGLDYLRHRKVWVAYRSATIFVQ